MDIYLTVMDGQSTSGGRLVFPMLPEEIRVKTGALFQSYNILKLGTVKLHAARDLTGFSWSGILPGERRQYEPYVRNWTDPKELQTLWSIYERDGVKLRLMVTETPINHDVYIENYDVTYKHGLGDYHYTINFWHAVDIKIKTSGEAGSSDAGQPRPSPPPANSHTVAPGESLWSIAQKTMGDGAKYTEIYEANKDLIDAANDGTDADKYLIHPGQIISVPKPAATAPPKPKSKPKPAPNTIPKSVPAPQTYDKPIGPAQNQPSLPFPRSRDSYGD